MPKSADENEQPILSGMRMDLGKNDGAGWTVYTVDDRQIVFTKRDGDSFRKVTRDIKETRALYEKNKALSSRDKTLLKNPFERFAERLNKPLTLGDFTIEYKARDSDGKKGTVLVVISQHGQEIGKGWVPAETLSKLSGTTAAFADPERIREFAKQTKVQPEIFGKQFAVSTEKTVTPVKAAGETVEEAREAVSEQKTNKISEQQSDEEDGDDDSARSDEVEPEQSTSEPSIRELRSSLQKLESNPAYKAAYQQQAFKILQSQGFRVPAIFHQSKIADDGRLYLSDGATLSAVRVSDYLSPPQRREARIATVQELKIQFPQEEAFQINPAIFAGAVVLVGMAGSRPSTSVQSINTGSSIQEVRDAVQAKLLNTAVRLADSYHTQSDNQTARASIFRNMRAMQQGLVAAGQSQGAGAGQGPKQTQTIAQLQTRMRQIDENAAQAVAFQQALTNQGEDLEDLAAALATAEAMTPDVEQKLTELGIFGASGSDTVTRAMEQLAEQSQSVMQDTVTNVPPGTSLAPALVAKQQAARMAMLDAQQRQSRAQGLVRPVMNPRQASSLSTSRSSSQYDRTQYSGDAREASLQDTPLSDEHSSMMSSSPLEQGWDRPMAVATSRDKSESDESSGKNIVPLFDQNIDTVNQNAENQPIIDNNAEESEKHNITQVARARAMNELVQRSRMLQARGQAQLNSEREASAAREAQARKKRSVRMKIFGGKGVSVKLLIRIVPPLLSCLSCFAGCAVQFVLIFGPVILFAFLLWRGWAAVTGS